MSSSLNRRVGTRCTHAFETVPAQAVDTTQRIDHPGLAGGGWAKCTHGLPRQQAGNQTPGPSAKFSRVSVRLHDTHPGMSMRSPGAVVTHPAA